MKVNCYNYNNKIKTRRQVKNQQFKTELNYVYEYGKS